RARWVAGRAAVRPWVEARATEEVVFDELEVGVVAEGLVVDVAAFGVGADHAAGDADAVPVGVDAGRGDVVVEATPVVPGNEDGGVLPVGAAHHVVAQTGDSSLADVHTGGGMLTAHLVRGDP